MSKIGLDNGIYVKSNKRKLTRADLPVGIRYPFGKDYNEQIEILYWRKNWGLRNAVLEHFGTRFTEDYITEIDTPDKVLDLMEIIVNFMSEEAWEEDGNSIWTYEEILPVLKNNIVTLALMVGYMQENPDVYLEFYDSY